MKPRILMALPQMPQDPASGAARTAQTAVEMARAAGFEVQVLGTVATERGSHVDPVEYLESVGLRVAVEAAKGSRRRELRFAQRGIEYTLLDTGRLAVTAWEESHGRQFDRLFDHALSDFEPDLLFTYGSSPGDIRRMRRAKAQGCRIGFCVFNLAYLDFNHFAEVDGVLTPSEFLADRYREVAGVMSTPLPTPLDPEDVVATEREPIFVTMVNPSVEKGLFFFARLAEELGRRHPEIALLTVESRGTAGMLYQAGKLGGFDLRRHESLMVSGPVPKPRDIYAHTRILLVPSVWEEPSGRVVAEALANGVPPLVSDRGGLAESCNGAGFVLPLPAALTVQSRVPVEAQAVEPWIEKIVKLAFDEGFYREAVAKTVQAAAIYEREKLAPRYVAFFQGLLEGGRG